MCASNSSRREFNSQKRIDGSCVSRHDQVGLSVDRHPRIERRKQLCSKHDLVVFGRQRSGHDILFAVSVGNTNPKRCDGTRVPMLTHENVQLLDRIQLDVHCVESSLVASVCDVQCHPEFDRRRHVKTKLRSQLPEIELIE